VRARLEEQRIINAETNQSEKAILVETARDRIEQCKRGRAERQQIEKVERAIEIARYRAVNRSRKLRVQFESLLTGADATAELSRFNESLSRSVTEISY